MALFNRAVRVSVDTPNGQMVVENLRVAFSIKKTLNWGTNTCQVSIWNMKAEKRAAIREYGDLVTLYAGYKDDATTGLLFIGRSTQVSHRFNQPEIVSAIECGDGERNLNTILFSFSYQENVSALTVLNDIAAKMGLKIAQLAPVQDKSYPKGWSSPGLCKESLDDVCNYLGLQWSVQNEELVILPVNVTSRKIPHQINIDTGMIGVPEQFTYRAQYLPNAARLIGWRVRTLLRPEILPGDEVRIQSSKVNFNLDASYKVIAIIHNGDTHGNPWDSTLEVIPVVNL